MLRKYKGLVNRASLTHGILYDRFSCLAATDKFNGSNRLEKSQLVETGLGFWV